MAVKIDSVLLDSLSAQAKVSERLRMNYDLRNSAEDTSQRMLNAIEPGSVVPVHRHRTTSETVVCLRGKLREYFYDDSGIVIESFEITAGGECCALNIPAGVWHSVEVLESGTVTIDVKDGAYEKTVMDDILRFD